ncbi:MAG: hypothetical protein JWN22_1221 [Nocardioides sp.]|jgi:hypothetical protein|nr:hypothetical protein [Nocardioides sp.]
MEHTRSRIRGRPVALVKAGPGKSRPSLKSRVPGADEVVTESLFTPFC